MKGLWAALARATQRLWSSTVGWSFAVVALRAGGFLLVLPIALRVLSPAEMGLWYLFVAISELCMTVEMGLANIIGRAASYFMGGMAAIPRDGLPASSGSANGRGPNYEGLAGLLVLARRVYGWIALGVVVALTVCGFLLVAPKAASADGSAQRYLLAYAVQAGATALSIFGLFWPNLLTGIGHMRLSQRALLIALLSNYATAAAGLLLGLGPMALALGQLALAGVTFGLARRLTLRACPPLVTARPQSVALGELWPATWRTMLAATGGYFCSYGTIFVCGVTVDLATTASYGLSFRLATLVHAIAGIWLQARIPGITTARAAGDGAVARKLVVTALPRCLATLAAGGAGLMFLGPFALQLIGSRTPLLPPTLLGFLLLLVVLDFGVGFHVAVLQTANRFPHLIVMIVSGAASMALAFALGRRFGIAGIVAAPMMVQAVCAYWMVPLRCWQDLRASTHVSPEDQKRGALV